MYIIADRLNASSKPFRTAIQTGDDKFLAQICRQQILAGAEAIDICLAPLNGSDHRDTVHRLYRIAVAQKPDIALCPDSFSVADFIDVANAFTLPLIFNSFGMAQRDHVGFGEMALSLGGRLRVIVSCLPPSGTHASSRERIDCGRILADKLMEWGLSADRLLFDPIWLPAHCGEEALRVTLDTAAGLHERFRRANVLAVTSNYSYGAARRYACEAKIAECAIGAGCDAFLCNPSNTALMNILRRSR